MGFGSKNITGSGFGYSPSSQPGASYFPAVNDEGVLIPGVIAKRIKDSDAVKLETSFNTFGTVRTETFIISGTTYTIQVLDIEEQ